MEEASVERGGLGGDPAVAPLGAVVDFGDRAGVGDFAEHGEGGVGLRWPAEVSACGRSGSVADEAEPRIRELLAAYPRMPATVIAERIGWSYSIRTLERAGARAAAVVSAAGSGVAHDLCGRRDRPVRFLVSQCVVPVGYRPGPHRDPVAGVDDGVRVFAVGVAVLIPTRAAEDLYAGWWQHLSTLGATHGCWCGMARVRSGDGGHANLN